MGWEPQHFLEELRTALDAFDHDRSAALCRDLVARLEDGETLPPGFGRRVLGELRRKCRFDLLEQVAEALRAAGLNDNQTRRHYAQALIDQGKTPAAVYVLELLLVTTLDDPEENAEARGLLGRVYKQLYVNATNGAPAAAAKPLNRRNLERAITAYHDGYRADPARRLWHGINTVALVARAARDGVPLAAAPDQVALATTIRQTIEAMPADQRQAFDIATAVEASVALGDMAKAVSLLGEYVLRADADAFELSSTERQLREVWNLDVDSRPGSLLLPLLQSEILRRRGGRLELPAADVSSLLRGPQGGEARKLERFLGPAAVVSLQWFRTGLERSNLVAQVQTQTGDGVGTGFLMPASQIHPALGEELLLVTNAHVVSDEPNVRASDTRALAADDAVITFEALEATGNEQLAVKAVTQHSCGVVWSSPPQELDCTVLRLQPRVTGRITPYPIAGHLPPADGKERVYIIGHPGGRGLAYSLQDNELLDYDDRLLHYRAPTTGGSSGSPVFDQQWRLIGVHHAGGEGMQRLNGKRGRYEANEAIQMRQILSAARGRA